MCIVCANKYGVNESLEDLNFLILKFMGKPLSDYIKDLGIHILAF